MARNRRSSRRTVPRRRMFWADSTSLFTAGPTTAPTPLEPVDLLEQFGAEYGADLFGFTVTRIRGRITWAYDQTTVVERHDASFGIRVADEGAINNLTTEDDRVQISPTFDKHADWMWVHQDTHYTNLSAGWMYAQYSVDVDIKAQRRIDELGQSLYLLGSFGGADFESFVNMFFSLRVLCKRP